MLYLLLTLILTSISFFTYYYAKKFFNDGIDYSCQSSSSAIHKHIHNNVICANINTNNTYYQFNNIKIPTLNGHQKIQSLLITPFGLFIFDTKKYKDKLQYCDLGFSVKDKYQRTTKVFISSLVHKPSIDSIYQLLPNIDNLKVYYHTVITSEVEFTSLQPRNIIQLHQIESLITDKKVVLSKIEINQIVGHLFLLNNQTNQIQYSKSA